MQAYVCGVALFAGLLISCEPQIESHTQKPATGSEAQVPSLSMRLSPEQAYAAIPTRRTELDLGGSDVDGPARAYVEQVFACIDEAIVLRVMTLDEFFAGLRDFDRYSARHERLRAYLDTLPPPPELMSYKAKILEALDAQRAFFAEWAEEGAEFAKRDVFSHPEVWRCSMALRAAYQIILDQLGPQARDQHQAFHDYHCALDFL